MPVDYILNKEGDLVGFAEFWVVDEKGRHNIHGSYIYVNEWVISKRYRGNGSIAVFAKRIMNKVPWAEYCYFNRGKRGNKLKLYPRSWWEKILKRFNKEE